MKLTWRDLTKAEPRLERLYADVRQIKDDKSKPAFCANFVWYGYGKYRGHSLKERMYYLVGFMAANPELRTMDAYDIAYRKLYDALPDCRNCGCI
jgi:hypothetical protein